ncbi:MAG: hypothetical protein FWD61_11255 [Phycisphaerales bacterium]|nr:hypothetical protein [Phycisphaerales bacterium]
MSKIFDDVNITKEQSVAAQIDVQVKNAAQMLKRAYEMIFRLVYQNPQFRKADGSFDMDAVCAAFAANTKLGLTPEQLKQLIRLTKATLNLLQPDTITDDVSAATVSFE